MAAWLPKLWAMSVMTLSGGSCASTTCIWIGARAGQSVPIPSFPARRAKLWGSILSRRKMPSSYASMKNLSIHSLERAQGYIRLPSGRAVTGFAHEYERHGTTTLFAALETALVRLMRGHGNFDREFLDFMNGIIASYGQDEDGQVILDKSQYTQATQRPLA